MTQYDMFTYIDAFSINQSQICPIYDSENVKYEEIFAIVV